MCTAVDNLMAGLVIVSTLQEEAMAGSNPTGRNPFVLPPDEEVFRMREADKNQKAQDRITRRGQKVSCNVHTAVVARTRQENYRAFFLAAGYNFTERTGGMR